MKFLTYRVQFIILVAWIPSVLLIFKIIDDRAVAAMIAGAGFILWPTLFIGNEILARPHRSVSKIHLLGCLQFLILFAGPIMYLRLANAGAIFNELSLFGVSASQLHRCSNISYMLMTVAVVYASYADPKNKNR